jgi:hypothetical protein
LELDLAVRIGRGHAASVGAIALLVIAMLMGFGAANHDGFMVRQEFTPALRCCGDMSRLLDELRLDEADYFTNGLFVAGAEARFKQHVGEWQDAKQEAYRVSSSLQDRTFLDAIGHRFDQLLRVDALMRQSWRKASQPRDKGSMRKTPSRPPTHWRTRSATCDGLCWAASISTKLPNLVCSGAYNALPF